MLLKITREPGDLDLSEENDMNTHWHTYVELQKLEDCRSNARSNKELPRDTPITKYDCEQVQSINLMSTLENGCYSHKIKHNQMYKRGHY